MIEYGTIIIGTYRLFAANKLWINLEVQGWQLIPIDQHPCSFDELWARHYRR